MNPLNSIGARTKVTMFQFLTQVFGNSKDLQTNSSHLQGSLLQKETNLPTPVFQVSFREVRCFAHHGGKKKLQTTTVKQVGAFLCNLARSLTDLCYSQQVLLTSEVSPTPFAADTVDGSEIPRPTTGWMVISPYK